MRERKRERTDHVGCVWGLGDVHCEEIDLPEEVAEAIGLARVAQRELGHNVVENHPHAHGLSKHGHLEMCICVCVCVFVCLRICDACVRKVRVCARVCLVYVQVCACCGLGVEGSGRRRKKKKGGGGVDFPDNRVHQRRQDTLDAH